MLSNFGLNGIKQFFLAVIIVFIPLQGMGQINGENHSTSLESSFRVTVTSQLFIQRSPEIQNNTSGVVNQEDLFYQRPIFGINLEWYGWSYTALNPRISYYRGSDSHFEDRSFAWIGIPGLHEDTYDFRLLLLEPGLKISLPFSNVEVFWTAGPTFGFGTVKLEEQITPVRHENGEAIPRYEDVFISTDEERRSGVGFYFSTGVTLPISSSFRLQGEIGYRRLDLKEFDSPTNAKFDALNYQLDSFTPSLGITYIIR